MENTFEEVNDLGEMLDKQCCGTTCHNCEKRIEKLETTVRLAISIFGGSFFAHIIGNLLFP